MTPSDAQIEALKTPAPALPTPPKRTAWSKIKRWFIEHLTRAGRDARVARKLAADVSKALANPNSAAGVAVTQVAQTMARGMVARWMDDRGVLRCANCLTTGGLIFKGKTREGKKVYVCEVHKDLGSAKK